MERIVDLIMTRLFQLAEYVCGRCSFLVDEPATPQEVAPTIRFTDKVDCKQVRQKNKMVEGNLFQ